MVCCCDTIGSFSRLIVIGFTAGGIIFQVLAALECEFIKYEATEELAAEDASAELSRTIGLFTDQNSTECPLQLNDYEGLLDDDSFFKTARSMIVLSIIGASLAGAMVMFEFFCCRVCCAVLLENLAYMASIVTGGLAFLAYHNVYCDTWDEKLQELWENQNPFGKEYDEPFECTFGKGSTYNVCAVVFYAVAIAVLCCSPKPTPLIHQMRK